MLFTLFPAKPISAMLHHEVITSLGFPVYFVGRSPKKTISIYGTTVELLQCHRLTFTILYSVLVWYHRSVNTRSGTIPQNITNAYRLRWCQCLLSSTLPLGSASKTVQGLEFRFSGGVCLRPITLATFRSRRQQLCRNAEILTCQGKCLTLREALVTS